jgi:hypothetical protein
MSVPNRRADYYGPKGSAFWFVEMIYLGAGDVLHKLETDPKDNRLISTRGSSLKECRVSGGYPASMWVNSDSCDRCRDGKVCENYCFQDHVQKAYEDFVTRSLEHILLGAANGND